MNIEDLRHKQPKNFSKLNEDTVDNDSSTLSENRFTAANRLSALFLNSTMSDVTFKLAYKSDNVITMTAHRLILAMTSPVFYAMFYGRLRVEAEYVCIEDVEPDAFRNMLSYIYTDNVDLTSDNVIATLYAAKKYNIDHLESICVEYLKCLLDPSNVFLLLEQARIFDENKLINDCLCVIDRFASQAFESEYFLVINRNTLFNIIRRNSLAVREVVVFEALIRWAEHQCKLANMTPTKDNKRLILGDQLIYSIRFPLMSLYEFSPLVPQSGLLNNEDLVKLYMHFTTKSISPDPFINTPRDSFLGSELIAHRFKRVETRWGYSGTTDKVRFFVNKFIYVVALGLYGSIHGQCEYNVKIEIIDYDSNRMVASNSLNVICDGTRMPFRAEFKGPVEILPNVNYVACATLWGPDSFYGTMGLRRVTVEDENYQEVTFNFTYASDNNNGTNVEDGQIPQIIFHFPATNKS